MKKKTIFEKEELTTYNQTFSYISETYYPKNVSELKKIIKRNLKNENFLLKNWELWTWRQV